jgi:hypothetical protein
MEEIIVTASRNEIAFVGRVPVMAVQEELGDLKLYRIPEPVTVAANSQKQVALLEQPAVKVEAFYRARIEAFAAEDEIRPTRILKTRNRKQEGLGLPLPAGGFVLFGAGQARPVLIGEGSIADRAVGEDVEIELGEAPGVIVRVTRTKTLEDRADQQLVVTNDQPRPVRFDAEFADVDEKAVATMFRGARLGRRNGRPVWSVTVPANGSATLKYRIAVKD